MKQKAQEDYLINEIKVHKRRIATRKRLMTDVPSSWFCLNIMATKNKKKKKKKITLVTLVAYPSSNF